MSDLLTWSPIHLGRWFGTPVRVHVSLILLVAVVLFQAPFEGGAAGVAEALAWLALYLAALAVHEGAHALAGFATDCESDEVHVWPLGNLAGTASPSPGANAMLTILAGPFASGVAALTSAAVLGIVWDAQFAWNPLGRDADPGAPWIHGAVRAEPMSGPWLVGWFGYINYWLFLANLLPAPPFDGGRLFRWFQANAQGGSGRDGLAAPWTAHTTAAILFLIGVARLLGRRLDGFLLIGLAVLIELMVRSDARIVEDGGYFDDGLFGYDFSEGYTSLEAGAPRVRPRRESALKRWRRRRADLRRQRRIMQEVAEERRMDEILDKLHRLGKGSLTEEEQRFLVRVSARFRNRPKAQD